MSMMIDTANEKEPTRRNWVSFWALLTLQTQNAFNDKAAQFLLIPLAGLLAFHAKARGEEVGFLGENMAYVLGALMVLPFILLAPVAGWLSDRYSKTRVIRATLCLQFAVLLLISLALWMQSLPLAVFGFFLLSVESVLLSPAKKGITKELVGHSHLGFASGVLEMSVILAVCAGQIISGWWYDARLEAGHDTWQAALLPLALISAGAFLSLGVSLVLERVPSVGRRPFEFKIIVEHFGQLKTVWRDRRLRLSGVGVSFFWGFAGFINLVAIQIGSEMSGGGGEGFATENSWLMLAASGGIALGGVVASLVCKKKIELGLIPFGGLIMVIGSMALALGPIERGWLMVWLAIAGAGGALLLVPLNAYLQDVCPPETRGKVLAGLNLMDCLAGLFAVAVQFAMEHWKVSYFWQFSALAMVSLGITLYSARLLPQDLARFVVLSIFRSFYKVKVLHGERIPKTGGVLMVCNHVSYIDGFILSATSPRPIQFLLFDEYFNHPWVGRVVRFFGAIPISRSRAKDGVRLAVKALEAGEVVCIFPEGQLTRTGAMNEWMRGFELIARKAKCPVLPIAMDGVWGSIFSFERNRFLFKKPYSLPYRVRVNCGELIPDSEVSGPAIRCRVEALRTEAFSDRALLKSPAKRLVREVSVLSDPSGVLHRADELRGLSENEQREILANAMQVAELNALQRAQTVLVHAPALAHCWEVMTVAVPLLLDLKLVVVSGDESLEKLLHLSEQYSVDAWVGGDWISAQWRALGGKLEQVPCFDFSPSALQCAEACSENPTFPCLAQDGRVIAMSMPHPPMQTEINDPQEGFRLGTWGWLLPGFVVEIGEAQVTLRGPALGERSVKVSGTFLGW